MNLKLDQLNKYANGTIIHNGIESIAGVGIDSRGEIEGKIFIAITGEKFNGHKFIEDAFKAGASGAVFHNSIDIEYFKKEYAGKHLLEVDDTLKALGLIAKGFRLDSKADVIGITGSAGKTLTKDIVSHILRQKFRVVSTQGNFNNQIGVPLTLLKVNPFTERVVVELASNHPGEIDYLSNLVLPDSAMITNIYPTHLEFLKDLDGVWEEKSSIFKYSKTHFINLDSPWISEKHILFPGKKITYSFINKNHLADFVLLGLEEHENSYKVRIGSKDFGEADFTIKNIAGRHNVESVLAGLLISLHSGVDMKTAVEALSDFTGPEGRMERFIRNGIIVINDAYNSNPVSFKYAIDYLQSIQVPGKKVLVCSDMLELGETSGELHREIGEYLKSKEINTIILNGDHTDEILKVLKGIPGKKVRGFRNLEDILRYLENIINPGDLILFKGSHGTNLYKIPLKIKEEGL